MLISVFGDLNIESFSSGYPFIRTHFLASDFYPLPVLEVKSHNRFPQAKLKIFLKKTYAPLNRASRLSQRSVPKATLAAHCFTSSHRLDRHSSLFNFQWQFALCSGGLTVFRQFRSCVSLPPFYQADATQASYRKVTSLSLNHCQEALPDSQQRYGVIYLYPFAHQSLQISLPAHVTIQEAFTATAALAEEL